MEGLEPPRLSAPDPKSGAAANYATSALSGGCGIKGTRTKSERACLSADRAANYATSLNPGLLGI